MLVAVLVISLLLSFYVPQLEGLEDATAVVNQDAPAVTPDQSAGQSAAPSPVGLKLPQKNKILTIDEITKVLGANPGIQKMMQK